jgi:NAD(P)-dependent dehydrogenase (short-subunit alcohol dehydrogenase family)
MPGTLLVTGASRGIGASIARRAAAGGYDVALTYATDRDAAQRVAAEVEAAGRRALVIRADVASEADVVAAFASIDGEFGRLDAVAINAGITGSFTRVDEIDAAMLERVLAVNVVGAFLCAREAVRRMSTKHGGGGGAIVVISSRAAGLGSPNEYVHYAASKAAVDTLVLGLAKEVAREGIRVNAVAPGLIDTEIHARGGRPERVGQIAPTVPMGRIGTPEEVTEAVMWLLSSAASYVTGAVLDVSGGR